MAISVIPILQRVPVINVIEDTTISTREKVIDIRYSIVANEIDRKYGALISHCEKIKLAAKEICEINKSLPASEVLRLAKEKTIRWGR